MEQNHHSEFNQKDSDIKRGRGLRFLTGILAPVIAIVVCFIAGTGFVSFFKLPSILGTVLGFGLSAFTVLWLIPRLYVTNGAVAAFVTVDLLTKELVSYGPGFHFSFPWEARSGTNNVNLEEVAESYTVDVTLEDGTIKVPFSARLRPDIQNLSNFLSGVAAIAADLGDLISAKIVEFFTKVNTDVGVQQATKMVPELNNYLREEFARDKSKNFEQRFGIITGDITAGTIQVTEQIKETLGVLTESRLIDKAVAESYGRGSIAEVEEAIKNGELDREDVNRRRTQAMAMSGNLQGMDLKETTTNFRIQGLDKVDPKLAEAVASLAPALNALFATRRTQSPGGKSKTN